MVPLTWCPQQSLVLSAPMAFLSGSYSKLLERPCHVWGFTDSPAPGSAKVWAKTESGQRLPFPDTGTEPSRRMEMSLQQNLPRNLG